MQRALVRAADIHAGFFADRLQTLQLAQLGCVVIAVGNPVRRRDFFLRRIRNTRHNFCAIPDKFGCGNEYVKHKKIRRISQRETAAFLGKNHHYSWWFLLACQTSYGVVKRAIFFRAKIWPRGSLPRSNRIFQPLRGRIKLNLPGPPRR